jgi:hypothetical protein
MASTSSDSSGSRTVEGGTPSPSSLSDEVVAGALGALIALGCVLPPVVHLVTGPLGPFLGGFVAENGARPGIRGAVIIASMVGTGVAGLLATVATVLTHLVGRSELPTWFPSPGTLVFVVLGIWVYGVVLASIGVAISRTLGRREELPGPSEDRDR